LKVSPFVFLPGHIRDSSFRNILFYAFHDEKYFFFLISLVSHILVRQTPSVVIRPPKCSVHSGPGSSTSGRSSRATSAPPQSLAAPEVKERPVEKQSSRQASLPPVEVGSTMMLKVEDLDMLARLKLAREKEEDCMESLVDLGEADHDQEDGAYDEDEASEVSSRSVSRQSVVDGGKLITSSEETTSLKMEKKKETYMESTGLVLQEDNMTTYVV